MSEIDQLIRIALDKYQDVRDNIMRIANANDSYVCFYDLVLYIGENIDPDNPELKKFKEQYNPKELYEFQRSDEALIEQMSNLRMHVGNLDKHIGRELDSLFENILKEKFTPQHRVKYNSMYK